MSDVEREVREYLAEQRAAYDNDPSVTGGYIIERIDDTLEAAAAGDIWSALLAALQLGRAEATHVLVTAGQQRIRTQEMIERHRPVIRSANRAREDRRRGGKESAKVSNPEQLRQALATKRAKNPHLSRTQAARLVGKEHTPELSASTVLRHTR